MSGRIAESGVQLGCGIRKLRKQRRWKQDVLAEEAGLNRATISLIESAKTNPSMFDVEKIARALDTDMAGLLSAGRSSRRLRNTQLIERVGRNVAAARAARGFSRTELALRAGKLPQYIGTTERGLRLPSLVNILSLAEALETYPSSLVLGPNDGKWPYAHRRRSHLDIGSRLLAVREKSEASRLQAAVRAGIDPAHLKKIELGIVVPTLPIVLALAAGMSCEISELLD